jgi:uridine kinase
MKNKTVVVLRAVSGAGKSTFANILTSMPGWVTVCADDYFIDDQGNYNFDASKLDAAHSECQQKFMDHLNDKEILGIVVANTNTKKRDFGFYEKAAKQQNATFISLVLENRHGNTDVHNVPETVKQAQANSIKTSLLLF